MTMTLNKLDVARAAAKAYRDGRLSAQGPTPACKYRDASGCPCVIGAAIDDATAAAWDARSQIGPATASAISRIHEEGVFVTDDIDALAALQTTHDGWAEGYNDETDLVDLLNIILPPEEQIDAALAACGEG